ncbi:recombinase RecT [Tetragenococcus halophilus]|uniref:RecT protein n=1 Tax=Tetragenococcus halophilus (strain DSM 20338 / JCM 20259 / NCIMB 9735 / NBRC 12172) TaxID=945021 RepID=A0AAN1SFQ0_TETHN|nr:RecT family recombinase [Tetragenococcus halophilus]BAK94164.1 putative RecT protein [Tetragenococcus halophilus NBRC 12172]GBD70788.1 putative RecT protein [Tetragenococcus halophilus subsp. halophilus]
MANEIKQKDITSQVNKRVGELKNEGLTLPTNYNYSNALKSAYFAIEKTKDRYKKPALEVCTKESIANALLNMVIQGLTPAKTQCYFIVYGDELQLQRSYFGTQAVLKRLGNVSDIWAEVVHKGDKFEIGSKRGKTTVKEFEPSFENQDNEIIGAFCGIEKTDGEVVYTVMTKKEIDTSWKKSKTGATQKEFPQEMAKRTVINRAAKTFINTSNDDDHLTSAINETTSNEYDNEREVKQAEPAQVQKLEEKIKQNAPQEEAEEPNQEEREAQPEQAEPINAVEHYEETKEDAEPQQEALFETPNFDRDERAVEDDNEDDYPF